MKIVVDSHIPFIQGVFEPYFDVVYKEGADIRRRDVLDADALIIRTRTACNGRLLFGTSVKMIATATIGMDHIDTAYCARHGIHVANAAGCNAVGVMNYVISALYGVAARDGIDLRDKTFGIIGVGNVGSRVADAARYLGFKVLLCDPPRAAREGDSQFVEQEYLLKHSDIVSLHVPLTGDTKKMADAQFFSDMKVGAIFINAARGEVVSERDLLAAIPTLGPVIIDTWNGEPRVNRELLDKVAVATPHIAGYSYQGKQKGTAAVVRAAARFFGISDLYEFYPREDDGAAASDVIRLDLVGKPQGDVAAALQYNYPIFADDFAFRTAPGDFERLRSEYHYRKEFYFQSI